MASEVEKTVEAVTEQVEVAPVVTEAQEAAHGADTGEGGLMAEIKETVKDVAEQVEKLPVTQKVMEVARDVAGEVEKNPMAAKVIERVKTAADEVEKSPIATNVRKAVKDTATSLEKSPLLAAAHRVLLAGVGAVALAQDEIEDFVNRLVERGEVAEADGKKLLKDVLEKRKSVLEKTAEIAESPKKAADDLEKRIQEALARMNIPTKDEIEALGAKITALTRKVDELKKSD